MKVTKENRGITLVVLIITITVMLVLAGTAVYMGTGEIDKTKDQLLLTELEQVQHFVGERYIDYMKFKAIENFIGTEVTASEMSQLASSIGVTLIQIPNTYGSAERKYYRLIPDDLVRIGVENCQNTYVVNYLTGEIINETKLRTSTGQVLYSYLRDDFTTNADNNSITSFTQPNDENIVNTERDLFNTL